MNERELVEQSLKGKKESLEVLIKSVNGLVFNLSIRFLWEREDAEDATQEILMKVITNLSKYDHKSKFSTWVYRVAVNYLINLKKTKLERSISFGDFSEDLKGLKAPASYDEPDKYLLEKELKTGCTLAMLQCLTRDQRIAFVLGSVMKIKSNVGGEITGTSPANFRKRVEKSRKLIGDFLSANCGVYSPENKCRCSNRINTALKCGQMDRNNIRFAEKVEYMNSEMEELHSMEGIYHNHGNQLSDQRMLNQIQKLLETKKIMMEN